MGLFDKLKQGLKKTHQLLKTDVRDIFKAGEILDESKLDISFGSQIRSYIMQPYRLIKDHRTKFSVGDVDRVLDGDLTPFIRTYLMAKKSKGKLEITVDDTDDA